MDNISAKSSQEKYSGLSEKQRVVISIHGLLTIVIGSIAGFAWLISLAGYFHLVPLPALDISVLGEKELWRNAHTGPISHGMLIIIIVAISPLLKLTKKEARVMVYACIIEVWFNVMGFQSAPFTANRGLTPTGPFY